MKTEFGAVPPPFLIFFFFSLLLFFVQFQSKAGVEKNRLGGKFNYSIVQLHLLIQSEVNLSALSTGRILLQSWLNVCSNKKKKHVKLYSEIFVLKVKRKMSRLIYG